jgi:hypothetical protein
MSATLSVLGRVTVSRDAAIPASSTAVFPDSASPLLIAQHWIARLSEKSTASQSVGLQADPFCAIRPQSCVTSPNLRLTEENDFTMPLRPGERQGEVFRGRHGKLVVVKKKK